MALFNDAMFQQDSYGGIPAWLGDILRMAQANPTPSQGFQQQPNDAQLPANAQPTQGAMPQQQQFGMPTFNPMEATNTSPAAMPMYPMGGGQNAMQSGSEPAQELSARANQQQRPQFMGQGGGLQNKLFEIAGILNPNLRHLTQGNGTDDIKEYTFARQQGYKGTLLDWMSAKRAGAGEYGMTPIYGVGPDGKPVIMQLGKGGVATQAKMPEGVTLSTGVEKIDLGTHWGIFDKKNGTMVGTVPKDIEGKEAAEQRGKAQGDAQASLASIKSKMPGLESVVKKLDDLSNKATYTFAGKTYDYATRQLGQEPRESAVARAEYISMVDNQVLPLLRDTFGAAFTQKEGDTLRNTLGDPDKSPREKQAVLKSFIEQKRRDVDALESRTGKQPGSAAAPSPSFAPQIPPPPSGFRVVQ